MEIWVFTFPSVAHAFRAKSILEQHAVPVKLIPIPRSLSASCEGLAAQVDEQNVAQALELLTAHQVVMLYKGIAVKAR